MGSVATKAESGRSNRSGWSVARQTAPHHSSKVSSLVRAGRDELQAKLRISTPGDAFEQEADRVAEQVMRMPDTSLSPSTDEPLVNRSSAQGGTVQRICASCAEDEDLLQAKNAGCSRPETTPSMMTGIQSLRGGQPLSGSTRGFFEPRIGADFSQVRVHSDSRAADLASAVNARAFTHGNNVVFGAGEYSPSTPSGSKLLAHELTHVVQQGAASRRSMVQPSEKPARVVTRTTGRDWIQGAWFKIGKQRINVNYDEVILTPVGDYVSKIESMYISWTGAANANAIHAPLTALTVKQRHWVMLGFDLLMDNTKKPAHDGLNRKKAVKRLIARAPNTTTSIASPLPDMEKEVLQVSGWLEVALAAPLRAPTGKKLTDITEEFFPPTSAGTTKTSVSHLDKSKLKTRLTPALKHLIKIIDPRGSSSVGTRSLPTLKKLGDKVLGEAKTFFSPYSHTARSSVFSPVHSSFKISANIKSTTSGIDKDLRVSYLENRGQIVGNRRDAPNAVFIDKDIFFDASYNHNVASDRAELEKIAEDVEKDATIQQIVDALLAFTGRQRGRVEKAKIWLPLTYRKSRFPTECKARWGIIDTLSHEVLHALSHPKFSKQKVGMGQIIREGFTEVLGVQLYNKHIVPKAKRDAPFKSNMEQGLGSAPCADPPAATIGYKPSGPAAERIRKMVGDNNFRAAYFLGAVDKVGL